MNQNIAIASSLGWKVENYGSMGYKNLYWRLLGPDGLVITDGWTGKDWSMKVFPRMVPQYTTDLNACHEAWSALTMPQKADFAVSLQKIMGLEGNICGWIHLIGATAQQRADAYCKVMGIEWEDEG